MLEKARFIKLGNNGKWESHCLEHGLLRLGYYEVSHELASTRDKRKIASIYLEQGVALQAASNHARQIIDFYDPDPNILWITFSKGCLWWCRAGSEVFVTDHNESDTKIGTRARAASSPWSNRSIGGKLLLMSSISGRITRAAGYQGTICDLKADAVERLDALINDRDIPKIAEAKKAKESLAVSLQNIITELTWKDFEIFIDLIFLRAGWIRTSVNGETLKDIDAEFEIPLTNERAVIQIKSEISQKEFDHCAKVLSDFGADKMIFAYHSSPKPILKKETSVQILDVQSLARLALSYGLSEWLMKKA